MWNYIRIPLRYISREQIKLGRWGKNISEKQEEIKFILANSDHCGDKICGYPEEVNKIISDAKILKPAQSSVFPSSRGVSFSLKVPHVSLVSSW